MVLVPYLQVAQLHYLTMVKKHSINKTKNKNKNKSIFKQHKLSGAATRFCLFFAFFCFFVFFSCFLSGATLAIGAKFDINYGAVFILTRSGSTWVHQAKLEGFTYGVAASSHFGISVALSDDG